MEELKLLQVSSEKNKPSKDIPDHLNSSKSWPVPLPMKSLHFKGPHRNRRRQGRFKYAYMKNWLIPLDGPMSMEHLHFILDCFVVSFGPDPPQLGRYHPQSDPEEFTEKPEEDLWNVTIQEDRLNTSWPFMQESSLSSMNRLMSDEWSYDEPPQPTDHALVSSRTNFSMSTDDIIVRELSEMRMVLERILENRDLVDWEQHNGLRDILSLLPDGNATPKEPTPHYPVGDWEFEECGICLEEQWLYRRACCLYPACSTCLQTYYTTKVEDGKVKIECCNTECDHYVPRDEISARVDQAAKEKFHKLLILANQGATVKTCPRCSHVTRWNGKAMESGIPRSSCVVCPSCELEWCFSCHAPWHSELNCKQFRKGDRLLRSWAREKNHGQLNAQKCPKCKIYIQRTTGCDHMHCTRCKTDFCYKCGDRFRYLKFFGDHYSKLSVFGCKYRFKADRPVQRKVIRGAIFGGKLIAAPVVGALALCAGALAVGVSVFALPVYGGVRLYRHCESRHLAKAGRRHPPRRLDCSLRPVFEN